MDGFRSIICVLFAGAGLACSMGAGCTVNDGGAGGDPYAQPGVSRSYDDSDGYTRHYDEPAPAPSYPPAAAEPAEREGPLVPNTARMRAEGRGDLSFKATRDGYVYVVDTRDKKLIFQGPLDEDETILIAPFRNVIEVDGVRVKRVKNLDNKHIHRIFFERDSDSGRNRRDRDRDRRDR